jgi:hypothetical protein
LVGGSGLQPPIARKTTGQRISEVAQGKPMQDLGDLAAWIRCAYEARLPELTPHEQSPVPGEEDPAVIDRITRQAGVGRPWIVLGVEAE